jgi:predicted ATP-dependent endonuclease of OLD family
MRIERLKIRNFRSLRSVDLVLPQVCALVGPNSSGKSNILKALKLALAQDWVRADSVQDADRWMGDPSNDVMIGVKFTEPVPYKKFKYQTPVEVHGICHEFGHKASGEPSYTASCRDRNGEVANGPMQAPKRGAGAENKFGPIYEIPEAVREAVPTIYIGTDRSMKDQLPDRSTSMLRRMLRDVEEELQSPECCIDVKGADGIAIQRPRQQHFRTLMAETMKTLRTSKFEALETSIRKHILENLGMDPIKDAQKLAFHFEPLQPVDFFKALDLRVTDDSGFQAEASDLSDGVQNAMVLAILRTYEELKKKGAIFLIEEPEMFLHPQMQRSLYKTLREIGKDNQVIYTTHSPLFVSVPDYAEVRMVRKGTRGTEVTASDHVLDEGQKLRMQKELTPDRNELFFANRVLVVEGDTEKLTLPVYAQRLGIDLDAQGLTILEVGGKNNLLTFARVAVSLGIPTGILFDVDRKPEDMRDNSKLYAFETDGHGKVWASDHEFEAEMRRVMTDEVYNRKCEELPGIGTKLKPARIAENEAHPIPEIFKKALLWLAGREDEV